MGEVDETGKRINPYKLFTGCWVPEWLAIRSEISQGAKLAYGRLCRYAGKDGKCNPRIETLAYEVGVKKRQASEYLSELKGCKLIEAERSGRGKSNWYYFLSHHWMNSFDMRDTATQKGVDMQDSASLNMQDTATKRGFDMRDSASPYKESHYLRETEEESSPRERIEKILEGITPPPALKDLFKVDGFRAAYLDYRCYLKEKYNFWPQPTEVVQDYKKLFELMQAGNPPVKVIEQTIQAKNKSFYKLRNFQKNDSDTGAKNLPIYKEL